MKPLLIYITARDKKQANVIGRTLVEERLAACANIYGKIDSFYFWEGKLCSDHEAVLIVKTIHGLLNRLVKRVKALHSYSVPCIVALPIIGGNKDFLTWVKKETCGRKSRLRR
jgi:periplasmic divalent cation tolerance protein